MVVKFPDEEFIKLKDMLVRYNCALKNVSTRMDILLEDFKSFQSYNPIEHIKTRLKSPESIAEKLYRLGHELTAENAGEKLMDIAGIRCICSYTNDVAFIAETLKRQTDLTVVTEKDYISKPKPSGYRSYHLIVLVPVFLTDEQIHLPVEIQIRTQAMDFWASLEHKVRYKYKNKMPQHLSSDLNDCAEKIAELDKRMFKIHDIVSLISAGDKDS